MSYHRTSYQVEEVPLLCSLDKIPLANESRPALGRCISYVPELLGLSSMHAYLTFLGARRGTWMTVFALRVLRL